MGVYVHLSLFFGTDHVRALLSLIFGNGPGDQIGLLLSCVRGVPRESMDIIDQRFSDPGAEEWELDTPTWLLGFPVRYLGISSIFMMLVSLSGDTFLGPPVHRIISCVVAARGNQNNKFSVDSRLPRLPQKRRLPWTFDHLYLWVSFYNSPGSLGIFHDKKSAVDCETAVSLLAFDIRGKHDSCLGRMPNQFVHTPMTKLWYIRVSSYGFRCVVNSHRTISQI